MSVEDKLSDQQDLRRRAFVMLDEAHFPVSTVARSLKVHPRTVRDWIARAKIEGKDAVIMGKKRTLPPESYRALSAEQQLEIQAILIKHLPKSPSLKLKTSLWEADSVRDLIRLKCQEDLSKRSVDGYLERWKIKQPNWGKSSVFLQTKDADNSIQEAKKKGEIFFLTQVQLRPLIGNKGPRVLYLAFGNRDKLYFMFDTEQPEGKASGWHLFLFHLAAYARKRKIRNHPTFLFHNVLLPEDKDLMNWINRMSSQFTAKYIT